MQHTVQRQGTVKMSFTYENTFVLLRLKLVSVLFNYTYTNLIPFSGVPEIEVFWDITLMNLDCVTFHRN